MNWQFKSDLPIYTQLVDQIKLAIVAGAYAPGQKLESVRELSTQAGVNPNTMQRALSELERLGLVYSQRTTGRYVTEEESMIMDIRQGLAKVQIQDFLKSMTTLGYSNEELIDLLKAQMKGGGTNGDLRMS